MNAVFRALARDAKGGQASRISRFDEDEMATVLPISYPPGLLKSSHSLLARDGRQSCH
jgi:hypothetical protein